jgi:predicted acyltransferase (DUF342 family)
MMFTSQAFQFILVVAAAFNAATSAQDAVTLLGAEDYVILASAGISTVPDSEITGDIAVSPIAATAMTGFSLTADSTNVFSESAQVTGQAFAADYAVPTPVKLTGAVSNMQDAYTDAAGRTPDHLNYGSGILGGVYGGAISPLTPGVYKFDTDVTIGDDITFSGGSTDIFIFQITGTLEQVGGTQVILSGVDTKNIFWQVSGQVNVGMGAHMEGIVLAKSNVLLETGSSINGRLLSQKHVALQVATVN